MMTVSAINGDGTYYSSGADNYYSREQDESRWFGKGAEKFGLTGVVDDLVFNEFKKGILPNGEERTGGNGKVKAGWDLTFSAPKSVSVLGLVVGDERFIDAHNKAVNVALKEIESIASVRLTQNKKTEIVQTNNIVAALYNHDVSRNIDPQLHTHAIVFNVTHKSDKWRSLSSDTVNQNGFNEIVYNNQIIFGQVYRAVLRESVEAMGFNTVSTGKNGLWEIEGVPTKEFSSRTEQINESVGENATAKEKEIAALDTRPKKQTIDPIQTRKHWEIQLESTGFNEREFLKAARDRQEQGIRPTITELNPKIDQAIQIISDNKGQFSYSEVLATTLALSEAKEGVIAVTKNSLQQAIEDKKLIPINEEGTVFTSHIHIENEAQLTKLAKKNKENINIIGIKGSFKKAIGLIENQAKEASSKGEQALIVVEDKKTQSVLDSNIAFPVLTKNEFLSKQGNVLKNITVIVNAAEKWTLSEASELLSRTQEGNLTLINSSRRDAIGSSLNVIKNSTGIKEQISLRTPITPTINTIKDESVRLQAIANKYVNHESRDNVKVQAGAKQRLELTELIRSGLKENCVLGETVTLQQLEPVYIKESEKSLRSHYKVGMVLEQYSPDTHKIDRFTITGVSEKANALHLVDTSTGETSVKKLTELNKDSSFFKATTIEIAQGEQLKALAKTTKHQAGETIEVKSITHKAIHFNNGYKHPLNEPIKAQHNYVESHGQTVGEYEVLAHFTVREMSEKNLNQILRTGEKVTLFTPIDESKAIDKLSKNINYATISEQVSQHQKPELGKAELTLKLAIDRLASDKLAFSKSDVIAVASELKQAPINEVVTLLNKNDGIISVGFIDGQERYVSKEQFDAEKAILTQVAQGVNSVPALQTENNISNQTHLTAGQQKASKVILESTDRFTLIQGYAGVGKTTQLKGVVESLNTLKNPPEIIGLAPTHLAVGEMQKVGVQSQTLASFLIEQKEAQLAGQKLDYRNKLFIIDEVSMVNTKQTAELYNHITINIGRAVVVGDTAQLKPIEAGEPFKLQQERSAAQVAVMKEIVRQTPELKPAIYGLIDAKLQQSLKTIEQVKPDIVPRVAPTTIEHSIIEPSEERPLYQLITADYLSRTSEARQQTLIVTHKNDDRRAINEVIHQERIALGELKNEQEIKILTPIQEKGQIRSLTSFVKHPNAIVKMNDNYFDIKEINQQDKIVMLTDRATQKTVLIDNFKNGMPFSLYQPETLKIAEGDKVKFTLTDRDNGVVTNEKWQVSQIKENQLTLMQGDKTKVLNLNKERHQHIDLGYATTAHGAQGASEKYVIALEGVNNGRNKLTSLESAYVALSRAKEHIQIYVDDKKKWEEKIGNVAHKKSSVHDYVLDDKKEINSARKQYRELASAKHIRALQDVVTPNTLGRGKNSKELLFPIFDTYGKPAGLERVSLNPDKTIANTETLADKLGFIGIQKSNNGITLTAHTTEEALKLAKINPDTGVIVRLTQEPLLRVDSVTKGQLQEQQQLKTNIKINNELSMPVSSLQKEKIIEPSPIGKELNF